NLKWDRSIDGYAYPSSLGHNKNQLFFNGIKNHLIYHVNYSGFASYNTLYDLLPEYGIDTLTPQGRKPGVQFETKDNRIPISNGGRLGLIKNIDHPNMLSETFKYSYSNMDMHGVKLTEYYSTLPRPWDYNDNSSYQIDTIQRKMYV